MPFEERVEKFPIELFGSDVRSAGPPPFRRRFAVMKSDATEQARVAENEGAFGLMEHQVIVFLGSKSGWFDSQLSGHPEMDPNPIPAGEFEEHLFSPRFGAEKARTRQTAGERAGIRAAKNSLGRVELHAHDFLTEAGVPLPAIKFDFGQLGHG